MAISVTLNNLTMTKKVILRSKSNKVWLLSSERSCPISVVLSKFEDTPAINNQVNKAIIAKFDHENHW